MYHLSYNNIDFLYILQEKHHNTSVHTQSHQLLFKMCINMMKSAP